MSLTKETSATRVIGERGGGLRSSSQMTEDSITASSSVVSQQQALQQHTQCTLQVATSLRLPEYENDATIHDDEVFFLCEIDNIYNDDDTSKKKKTLFKLDMTKLNAFADTLLLGTPWSVTEDDCVAVQTICDAALELCESGDVVHLASREGVSAAVVI